jgi:hypothetical protein
MWDVFLGALLALLVYGAIKAAIYIWMALTQQSVI